MKTTWTVLLYLCVGQMHCFAQSSKEPTRFSYDLSISKDEPLSSTLPSPMFDGTVVCTSDGSIAINNILEADTSKPPTAGIAEQLNVVAPDGHRTTFDFSKIDDLQDFGGSARAFDLGERDVVFLLYARPKSNSIQQPSNAVRGWFVARFDREGVYRGATELNLSRFTPQKIAVLSNGDFLIFGGDEINRKVQLLRYSPIGNSIFMYQPPAPFASKNDTLPTPFPSGSNVQADTAELLQLQGTVQFSQMVHYKQSILLLQMNAGAPLFQVFANGSIRTINIPKLDDFRADSLLSSDESIFVRYRRVGTNSGKGQEGLILEVDPNTGKSNKEIHTGDSTMWDVACTRRDIFTVMKMKSDYVFEFHNATLTPSK